MSAAKFAKVLLRVGPNHERACAEARTWAQGKTLAQAYAECARPDWLLWLWRAAGLADRWLAADMARLFAAEACDAVGAQCWGGLLRSLPPITDEDSAAQAECVERAAREALYAAYAAAAATAATAAAAAATAADAAAYAAAYAAARSRMRARCCDIIRARVPLALIEGELGRTNYARRAEARA